MEQLSRKAGLNNMLVLDERSPPYTHTHTNIYILNKATNLETARTHPKNVTLSIYSVVLLCDGKYCLCTWRVKLPIAGRIDVIRDEEKRKCVSVCVQKRSVEVYACVSVCGKVLLCMIKRLFPS